MNQLEHNRWAQAPTNVTALADTSGFAVSTHNDGSLAFLTVDEAGYIGRCEGNVERLLGFCAEQLLGTHISIVLPGLRQIDLVCNGQVNAELSFRCHLGVSFAVRPLGQTEFSGRLSVTDLRNRGARLLRLSISRSVAHDFS